MDPGAPAEVIAHAVERHGGVDVLVNNLGGPPPGDRLPHAGFLSRDDAHWHAILEFNLMTAVRFCRAALPILLERGGGSIVNVASAVGRQPAPMNLDYGAAKAAMLNLTKGLSEEFGAAGVRVNTVSPGPTLTPWWTRRGRRGRHRRGLDGLRRRQRRSPRSRRRRCSSPPGASSTPQEIADAVALLASPRSASTTGAEWVVDGGMLRRSLSSGAVAIPETAPRNLRGRPLSTGSWSTA